jgi:hypothetical protein
VFGTSCVLDGSTEMLILKVLACRTHLVGCHPIPLGNREKVLSVVATRVDRAITMAAEALVDIEPTKDCLAGAAAPLITADLVSDAVQMMRILMTFAENAFLAPPLAIALGGGPAAIEIQPEQIRRRLCAA